MTEINERVTVDFDSESYYLDGEYWESWDNYGEEMADKINELLNKLAEEKKELQFQVNLLREQANEFHRGARENANRVGQLKKENKELREQLKDCTEKAKEEIRKQAENDAIRWANIGR